MAMETNYNNFSMASGRAFDATTLDDLAWRIDRHGIDGIPASTLRDLGFAALDADASATLVALVVDPAEPAVARQRAFGRLAAWLARRPAPVADADVTETSEDREHAPCG